jgi:type III restriction enzyme
MEGWDCPFAYLLVMLDNTRAQRAITQLVGRVMRQPHARRTGRSALDQCYVYCHNTDVGIAVGHVKDGLEQEGLTGLGDQVIAAAGELKRIKLERRQRFQGKDIFLPVVNHKDGDGLCELDYQRHILPEIPWETIAAPGAQSARPNPAQRQSATVDVGEFAVVYHPGQELYIDKTVSILWFARRLADIVPNPWQAARIAQELIEKLKKAGESGDSIFDRRGYLASLLRDYVITAVEKRAERVFRDKLSRNEISFDLESSGHNFRMVESYEIPVSVDESALQSYGKPLQLSLFEPVLSRHFDTELERSFARYLDEQKALQWWHRVASRQQGDYYLRGWNKYRIWPDFVAMTGDKQILVFETKGEHLKGNDDTEYKRKVFNTLENAFNASNAGTMKINDGPAKGTFKLVFSEAEFPQALDNIAGAYAA